MEGIVSIICICILAFIWKWPTKISSFIFFRAPQKVFRSIFSIIRCILPFIWKCIRSILTFIWEWQAKIRFSIFYRAPQKVLRTRNLEVYQLEKFYLYAKLIRKSFYFLPWATLFIWYQTIRLGCGSLNTRPHLESICLRPYVDPNRELPRWLDYWDISADSDDTPDTLSLSDEALMIGYLDILDAVAVLRRQASELEDLPCTNCSRLLSILRQLIDTASDLAPQLDKCADRICIEQDVINDAFRDFVNFWGRATAMSTYQNLSILVMAFAPWWMVLGFLNHYLDVPFLPQPQLYLFQVEAEMRYQKQLLIDSSIAALDGIDESCRFPDPAQQKNLLEALLEKFTSYQEKVNWNIKESCPIWRDLFHHKTETCVTLAKIDTLGKVVRRRVRTIRDIDGIYKDRHRRIRDHFQQMKEIIHNSPSSEFSYKGGLTIPRPLEPYIQKFPFLIRQNNLGANGSSVTPHLFVYSYDLDFNDGTPPPILRSLVAQLCKESKNFNIVSGNLYMICAIQALEAKLSDLNKNDMSSAQRSWFVQRGKALSRYNKTKGFDQETIVGNIVNQYRASKNGTLVLE